MRGQEVVGSRTAVEGQEQGLLTNRAEGLRKGKMKSGSEGLEE